MSAATSPGRRFPRASASKVSKLVSEEWHRQTHEAMAKPGS
ncbi:MAG TPA: hypothetical protein VGK86_04320 [Thermoanaerobaculia bacterium]